MIRWLVLSSYVLSGCAVLAEKSNPQDEPAIRFTRDQPRVKVEGRAVNEASGVAVSLLNESHLWAINDSGGTTELHRFDTLGKDLGSVSIHGVRNIDWEDMASFRLDGDPYLLVADIGDNAGNRQDLVIYVVPEPTAVDKSVKPSWTIRFQFEDGAQDCESVAVDEKAEKIILISKRTKPPLLYELPLKPADREIQTARKIGKIAHVLPKGISPNPYGSQPTGFDISSDGSRALVLTYVSTFIFPRAKGETWADTFAKKPVSLGPHFLRQAESGAFSRDGKSIYLTSEGIGQPLIRYQIDETP